MFLEGGWNDGQGISESSLTTEKMAEVNVSLVEDDEEEEEEEEEEKKESCEGREGVDRRHLLSVVMDVAGFSEEMFRVGLSGSFRKGVGVEKSSRSWWKRTAAVVVVVEDPAGSGAQQKLGSSVNVKKGETRSGNDGGGYAGNGECR